MTEYASELLRKAQGEEKMSNDTLALCELCGEPMPEGETMFKYHGYSGPCPKPPLQKPNRADRIAEVRAFYNDMIELQQSTDIVAISKVLDAMDLVLELSSHDVGGS